MVYYSFECDHRNTQVVCLACLAFSYTALLGSGAVRIQVYLFLVASDDSPSWKIVFLEGHFFSLKLCIILGTPGFLIIAPTNDYLQTQLGACNLFDSAGV